MQSAHAAACGHRLLAPLEVLGYQFIHNITEPFLLHLGAVPAVSVLIGPGLLVDRIGAYDPEFARFYPGPHRLYHAEISEIPGVAVLGRESQAELAGMSEDGMPHLASEFFTVSYFVSFFHTVLRFLLYIISEFVHFRLAVDYGCIHLVTHRAREHIRHALRHDDALAVFIQDILT